MKHRTLYDPNRLCNLIFPLFMIYMISPIMWAFMIIGNFVVDSIVVLLAAKRCHGKSPAEIWKKSILRVVLFGFLSDLIASFTATSLCLFVGRFTDTLPGQMPSEYTFPGNLIYAIPAIILAGFLIYYFNRRFALKKTGLKQEDKKRIAMWLAIITAPYFMMIPTFM